MTDICGSLDDPALVEIWQPANTTIEKPALREKYLLRIRTSSYYMSCFGEFRLFQGEEDITITRLFCRAVSFL